MPHYPHSLLDALEEGKVLPFVGAGVSLAVLGTAGQSPLFPSWSQLLTNGANWLEREGKAADAELVRALIAVREPDYHRAAQHLEEQLPGMLWAKFLKSQFDRRKSDASEESLSLARSVWRLGSRLVLTTNYDHVLHWACPDRDDLRIWDIDSVTDHVELLRDGRVDRPTIWHLHGHIDNISKIVLTPKGYGQLYPDDLRVRSTSKPSWETLRSVLASRSFFFIGFSLRDSSFVDTVRWVSERFQGAIGPHYALVHESAVDHLRSLNLPLEPIVFSDYSTGPSRTLEELERSTTRHSRKKRNRGQEASKAPVSRGATNYTTHEQEEESQNLELETRVSKLYRGFQGKKLSLFAAVGLVVLLGLAGWAAIRREECSVRADVQQEHLPESRHRPALVRILPGNFKMGSAQNPDEKLHPVEITSAFLISATEVTQAQYHAVTGVSPVSARLSGLERRCRDRGLGGEHPVFCVSWLEAVHFCNRLSTIEGLPLAYKIEGEEVQWLQHSAGYRLPTEAEWEYAARAGSSARYWFGEESACLTEVAWFGGMDSGTSGGTSHPVAQKQPNPWGLYDVSGNVWEWVWDYYDEYPPQAVDPVGPLAPPNPGNPVRVWRGGSWLTGPDQCRHAFRLSEHPRNWYADLGFRIARYSRTTEASTQ